MIYTRLGNQVEILAWCGDYRFRRGTQPLLLVQFLDSYREKGYRFVSDLLADGGRQEIIRAVLYAPVRTFRDRKELRAALDEAAAAGAAGPAARRAGV